MVQFSTLCMNSLTEPGTEGPQPAGTAQGWFSPSLGSTGPRRSFSFFLEPKSGGSSHLPLLLLLLRGSRWKSLSHPKNLKTQQARLLQQSESQGTKPSPQRQGSRKWQNPGLWTVGPKGSDNVSRNLSPFPGSAFLCLQPLLRRALLTPEPSADRLKSHQLKCNRKSCISSFPVVPEKAKAKALFAWAWITHPPLHQSVGLGRCKSLTTIHLPRRLAPPTGYGR